MRLYEGVARLMLSRVVRTCGVAIMIAAVSSACSSSGSGGKGATTSTTELNAASIKSFTVPKSVQCGLAPSVNVRISYSVLGARSQQILIDGRALPPTDASAGTITAAVRCDGAVHRVALVAYDVFGHRMARVAQLTTVPHGPTGL